MGYFWVFSSMFAQTSYLFTFCFLAFPSVLIFQTQKETETKNPLFCRFCLKTSLFVANKVLIFSNLRLYRANHTPPPRFWHSQGGSALFRKFFIFLFFIFCKILWFCQFSFSTEFLEFLKVSYLLFFLHKVSLYLLLAISVRQVAFYTASWCSLPPDYFERLRTQILSYFYFLRKSKTNLCFRVYFCYVWITVFVFFA